MRAIPRAILAVAKLGNGQMKKLSEWQLSRLRDCLRAYHAYGTGKEKVSHNWKDVSEAIDEDTGTTIKPERLRQFVEGINDGAGGKKYPVPKAVDAIWKFVTDENVMLISEEELTEFRPSYQAGMRLLEYLDQNFDDQRIMPPAKLQGTYRARTDGTGDAVFSELVLEAPSSDGLITIAKTEEYFDRAVADDLDGWSVSEQRVIRNNFVKSSGWAILTPEDNLIFFLKDEQNGRNQYYFTLGSDFDHTEDAPVTELVLLAHDYPLDRDYSEADMPLIKQVAKHAADNILHFGRVA